jgi:hypothetical protein
MRNTCLVLALLASIACSGRVHARDFVWLEAESAKHQSFSGCEDHPDLDRSLLSGGDWLCNGEASPRQLAVFEFYAREDGEYTFWLRCDPESRRLGYIMESVQIHHVETAGEVRGRTKVAGGPGSGHLGWVNAGTLNLSSARHTLVLAAVSYAAVDCLCLVNFDWVPTGVDPPAPDLTRYRSPDEWFPVSMRDGPFPENSIIDMRRLIPRPAGQYGFLGVRGQGLAFDAAPSRAVKLWGTTAVPTEGERQQRQQADLYARHGINAVRRNTVQDEVGPLLWAPDAADRTFEPEALDRFDQWFAILREHGIYMVWSCFDPYVVAPADGYPDELYEELPNLRGGKSTGGFVDFEPQLQEAEWAWLRGLLLHRNPHTGLRYVDDPALAAIEPCSAVPLMSHPLLNSLAHPGQMPQHSARLSRAWAEWLRGRYADDHELTQAWGDGARPDDSLSNPAMAMYGLWQLTSDGPDYGSPRGVVVEEKQRMADFLYFLADTQRTYYGNRARQLRELGFRGLIMHTNRRVVGCTAGGQLWSDSVGDAVSRLSFSGGMRGTPKLQAGPIHNRSHMTQPGAMLLSVAAEHLADKPFLLSEWTAKPPNQWKAEAAPLVALYGLGLQGWDGAFHATGRMAKIGDMWTKGPGGITETPHYLGQFPALAFAIYNGHLQEAPVVLTNNLTPDEVSDEPSLMDPARRSRRVPTQAAAVGGLRTRFGEQPAHVVKEPLVPYWDKERKSVRSLTGELEWDYGRGVVEIRSDKTQGIVGFAGGATYDLPGVRLDVETPFVSILFTPLDDRPLVESEQILITAMARDKQDRAEYGPEGDRLTAAGRPPIMMEPVQASIRFGGLPVSSVRALDLYGVPTRTEIAQEDGTYRIDGRYATYYYEARR